MAPTNSKTDDGNKSTDPEVTEDRATQTVKRTYTREQLIEISKKPSSKKRPEYLKAIYNNSHGVWDPDLWSQDRKKDNVEEGVRSKRERTDSENQQQPIKKKFGDPKERLRDEQDGIILSPQRRSFGTGCHVSQAPPSRARPESPIDSRGSDREPSRRIGSGRIVNRERDFGNFRVGNKFERDDRDRDTRFMPRDGRRDLLDRRNNGRYHRVEEEPEWFSDGPTSQHDTIELHGFEDGPDDKLKRPSKLAATVKRTSDKKPGSVAAAVSASAAAAASVGGKVAKPVPPKRSISQDDDKQEKVAVGDFIEPKAPSSRLDSDTMEMKPVVEENHEIGKKEKEGDFDFDDFFRMENIPGFFAVNEVGPPAEVNPGLTGSRFGQFFQRECSPPMGGLRERTEDSRRSSIQDELLGPFTNDPTESSAVASSQSAGSDAYFAPISPVQPERTMSLLEMLQGPCKESSGSSNAVKNKSLDELARSGKAQSVQEIEAGLKSLVMRSGPSSEVKVIPRIEEDMSAFKKLVAQVSDGHVTAAASQGIGFGPIDKRNALCEKDILQVMGKHQEMQLNPRMENVLKNAPTEQDLLAGLVKGQPAPHLPFGGLTHHQHGCRAMPERQLHDDNPLAKLLGQHQQQGVQPQIAQHSGGGGPIQRLAPQSQGNSLQQHQREILSAILKQQQQQQQQLRRHPASPMQPPIIQCPPSPPPVVIQGPVSGNPATSPRSHSPHPADNLKHQQARLHQQQQQQQQQARVPSPLVFGQTPPVISHAPSPIHPSQVPVGGAINPNSLFVQSAPIMPRVLSPQELTLHTQHILQNALIKRKLEEQKENFRKRQEMQGATSAAPPTKFMTSSVCDNSSSNKAPAMSPTMASFTPTSVMRKMQAEKDKDGPKPESSPQGMPLKIPVSVRTDVKGPTMGKPTTGANGCPRTEEDRNSYPVRTFHGQQTFVNGHLGPVPVPQRVPAPVGILPVANQGTLQGRPIVKGNQGLQRPMHPNQVVGGPSKQYPAGNSNGFDVGKLFEQQRLLQHANQRQMSMSPMPPSVMTHSSINGRAIAGNPPLPNVVPQQGNAILRNAMHTVPVAAQQNQRLIDPYQQQAANNRMLQLHTFNSLLMGMGGGSGGRNVAINHPVAPYPVVGSGLSPTQKIGGVNAANDVNSGNLAKWFSVDVLRQRMPNLPPVPAQKAMSVEELEQQQQQAAAVHI